MVPPEQLMELVALKNQGYKKLLMAQDITIPHASIFKRLPKQYKQEVTKFLANI